jgi:hypothetical protein
MDDSSSDEIKQMKEELSVRIQEIHIALDELEFQQLVSRICYIRAAR